MVEPVLCKAIATKTLIFTNTAITINKHIALAARWSVVSIELVAIGLGNAKS